MAKKECGFWRCSHHIGLFLAALFIVCFAWYYIRGAESALHLGLFKLSFLGFNGMNAISFVLGLIQAYIWGYIAVGIWYLVGCCHKGGKCKK